MRMIYNISLYLVKYSLSLLSIFNPKLKLFVKGRKSTYPKLTALSADKPTLWFHCASLGEFEQGRPIMEACKKNFPKTQIALSFFSPSGYEIQKNYPIADVVVYLPLDTIHQSKKFIAAVKPTVAIFIKYEFWPNYLAELKSQKIKTILISGIFRPSQPFFKPYGKWMRKSLTTFDHFFVQNQSSKALLSSIGIDRVTLSGDTRFDRVFAITQDNIEFEEIARFKGSCKLLVAGSTWPKDEELLIEYINNTQDPSQKFIIAPHNIKSEGIAQFADRLKKKTGLFSNKTLNLNKCEVLIIDSIGLLSKLYKYADIAYVGGGFGTGIHNVLEPATFGVPICIGPAYKKFNEAIELVNLKACVVITNYPELQENLDTLFNNDLLRKETGKIAANYVQSNLGATQIAMSYLSQELS
ncbi:3-deoxy-D-manno-octulosonic acid transferase [Flavobacteriaceae bacterium F08102]|nr:3-deoxy-D-manno-octulosonic acid transferase [Flavobacteriaceae bacterium F08102]